MGRKRQTAPQHQSTHSNGHHYYDEQDSDPHYQYDQHDQSSSYAQHHTHPPPQKHQQFADLLQQFVDPHQQHYPHHSYSHPQYMPTALSPWPAPHHHHHQYYSPHHQHHNQSQQHQYAYIPPQHQQQVPQQQQRTRQQFEEHKMILKQMEATKVLLDRIDRAEKCMHAQANDILSLQQKLADSAERVKTLEEELAARQKYEQQLRIESENKVDSLLERQKAERAVVAEKVSQLADLRQQLADEQSRRTAKEKQRTKEVDCLKKQLSAAEKTIATMKKKHKENKEKEKAKQNNEIVRNKPKENSSSSASNKSKKSSEVNIFKVSDVQVVVDACLCSKEMAMSALKRSNGSIGDACELVIEETEG